LAPTAPTDHPRLRRALRVPAPPGPPGDPGVVVIELAAGRLPGGHNEGYLAAVLAALDAPGAEVWAPDRDGWGRPAGWARRAQDVALTWLAMHPPRGRRRVVVTQAPSPWELLTLRAVTVPARRRRAVAVFVVRRSGATGSRLLRLLSRLSDASVRSLVRARRLWPASDSRLILDRVEAATGVRGTLLPIPPRGGGRAGPRTGPPVVGLLGSFRMEKGAAHYDAIIRAALDHAPDVEVDVQVGEGQRLDRSDELARRVREAWAGHPRVRLHGGYLDESEYDAILARSDLVVLPYDVDAYGGGTSAILHEAVAGSAAVLTTPIAWAVSEYGDHPRVRFLDALDEATLRPALGAALELGVGARGEAPGAAAGDEFAERWREATRAAAAWTDPL
jgi:glycosyltransferase involved in cell wall biosynthesis